MNAIVSLFHFIYNLFLFLIAAIILVGIAALLYGYQTAKNDALFTVDTGSSWGRSLFDAEARSLYALLKPQAEEINRPASTDPTLIAFSIDAGDTAQAVAAKLQALRLIQDAELFMLLLRYNDIDTRLQTGDYYLRRNMTMRQVGTALFRGRSALLTVTVPPGWRLEQLAEHLALTNLMDGREFLKYARQGTAVDHPLLADRPWGKSYEGYLFPGTYYLLDDARPEDLISQMLDRMAREIPANAFELARQRGLSYYDILILASIVEREAVVDGERPLIASVYLNRLGPQSPHAYLQADPTVQYAMGYQADTGQWWKSPVQLDEYSLVDSSYNTYLYAGLPPGPIASPGINSIMAALYPANTNYLFFVCERPGCQGGTHAFAQTYEEHLQNVAVYWDQ